LVATWVWKSSHRLGQSTRGVGLHHERGYRGDQHRLDGTLLTVAGQIANHLATSGRMPDAYRIAQVQMPDRNPVELLIGLDDTRDRWAATLRGGRVSTLTYRRRRRDCTFVTWLHRHR